jgi:hypothetical protein
MQTADLKKFAVLMATLAEVFDAGKEVSKIKMEIYFKSLEKHPIEHISQAISNMINTRVYPSFPKPAEILQEINGRNENRATEAWLEVLEAVKRIGNYQSVKFADPVIHSVVQVMGGWDQLAGSMTLDEEKWKQKEFERLYQVMERRGDHPAYLPGYCEMQNGAKQIAVYEERTGEKFKQNIVLIGSDETKQPLRTLREGL